MAWMMQGKLATFVGSKNGASKLLFDGPVRTREIQGEIAIRTERGRNEYAFGLHYASGTDSLFFSEEKYRFTPHYRQDPYPWNDLGAGHKESAPIEAAENADDHLRPTARTILGLLRGCWVHQFHNTSDTARFKEMWAVSDKWNLKEDAGNLGPFLLRQREEYPSSYNQIVSHCRRILPFFDDFVLVPERGSVLLQWRERNSDVIFDTSMASDGMMRVFALLALLCQPAENFPDVLLLDEPELGLHPAAIELVAGLLKSASTHTQIIAATQSAPLLNQFDPEEITVVERRGRESFCKKLNSQELEGWLEDYTLSDLLGKNIFGGRPNG
jgi:predicted ATPase